MITVEYPDNYDAPRAGTVLVRWPTPTQGQNVHLSQAGCRYAVTKTTVAFAGCRWRWYLRRAAAKRSDELRRGHAGPLSVVRRGERAVDHRDGQHAAER